VIKRRLKAKYDIECDDENKKINSKNRLISLMQEAGKPITRFNWHLTNALCKKKETFLF